MRRGLIGVAVLAFLLAMMPAYTAAQDKHTNKTKAQATSAAADEAGAERKGETPIPPETTSVTHHSVEIDGRTIRYTATAGTLLIRDDKTDKPNASVFYVAYTAEDTKDAAKRPVTFLYNGGPGSSSVWLHMGSVGPVRVETASAAATPPAPYRLVPNKDSLLDRTDLVFVDAVGTGFSKPVGKGTGKDFWGVDEDVKAFAKAITRYVTINHRWNSPKFLFGESYGTTRSAALVAYLQGQGMAFNGVVLVSSILNYAALSPGLDHSYVGNLPSFAAIAWYHDRIPDKPAGIGPFLDEVRGFALGPYAAALAKGQNLSQAEEDRVAQKLAQYTGLSVKYLEQSNLRVSPSRFRKELLRDQRRSVGRYDARYQGIDLDVVGDSPDFDASDTAISGAFTAAFNDYIARELKWASEVPYKTTSFDIIKAWDWKHAQPGSRFPLRMPYVAGDLARAMTENPRLKVFSANGYFDLATPFFLTEYDLGHMELDPALRKNLEYGYYPSGHMIYLNTDALVQLKTDLAKFYDDASHG